MNAFSQWLQQLQFGSLLDEAMVVLAAILSITVHETCHGLVALWLGDPTAKNAGRLTLNPLHHIDFFGLVMLALVKFGWAKPVPIDPRYFKNPKGGMAVTALAGPVSNVLLAYVALLFQNLLELAASAWGVTAVLQYLYLFFYYLGIISAGLAVFNLIPVPPLDGSKVLFSILPDRAYSWVLRYERYGMALLMVLLLTGYLTGPLTTLRTGLLSGLQAAADLPFQLLLKPAL